jgi:hypothetical protein
VGDVGQPVQIGQSPGVLVALDRLRPQPHGSLGDATTKGLSVDYQPAAREEVKQLLGR